MNKEKKINLTDIVAAVVFLAVMLLQSAFPKIHFFSYVLLPLCALCCAISLYMYYRVRWWGLSLSQLLFFSIYMLAASNIIEPVHFFSGFFVLFPIAALLIALVITRPKKYKTLFIRLKAVAAVMLVALSVGYGMVFLTNTVFDDSEPVRYEATVESKEERDILSKSGSLDWSVSVRFHTVAGSGCSVAMPKAKWEKIGIGDVIVLEVKEGLYSFPYYTEAYLQEE